MVSPWINQSCSSAVPTTTTDSFWNTNHNHGWLIITLAFHKNSSYEDLLQERQIEGGALLDLEPVLTGLSALVPMLVSRMDLVISLWYRGPWEEKEPADQTRGRPGPPEPLKAIQCSTPMCPRNATTSSNTSVVLGVFGACHWDPLFSF